MRHMTLTTALAVLAVVQTSASARAHDPDVVLAGVGTATIDGVLSPEEWTMAGQIEFSVAQPWAEGAVLATLRVMNDSTNLYIALSLSTTATPAGVRVLFDNDHDGLVETGDDVLFLDALGFRDEVRVNESPCLPRTLCAVSDAERGGTSDGAGMMLNDGVSTVYELSHPLRTSYAARDIHLGSGDTVGFNVTVTPGLVGDASPEFFAGTSFPSPSIVTGTAFGDLHITPIGADYLIITDPAFHGAMVPLAQAKRRKGYITKIVDTSTIAPAASAQDIAAYIKSEFQTKSPKPRYVLLVGDADRLPAHSRVPCSACSTTKMFASDLEYATMTPGDYFPDLMVGRLPVRTPGEASTVVSKILNYNPCRNGNKVLLFGNSPETTYADGDAKILAKRGFVVDKAYAPVATSQDVFARINEGRLLIAYYGHGTVACYDNFFCEYQLGPLANTDFPLVISGGCGTGNFAFDLYQVLGERLLVSSAGAIGYIGASRNSGGYGYKYKFADGLYKELARSGRIGTMIHAGFTAAYEAAKKAGLNVGNDSWTHTFFEQTILLGDPELRMRLTCLAPNVDGWRSAIGGAVRQLEADALGWTVRPRGLARAVRDVGKAEAALDVGRVRRAKGRYRAVRQTLQRYVRHVGRDVTRGNIPEEIAAPLREEADAIVVLASDLVAGLDEEWQEVP